MENYIRTDERFYVYDMPETGKSVKSLISGFFERLQMLVFLLCFCVGVVIFLSPEKMRCLREAMVSGFNDFYNS